MPSIAAFMAEGLEMTQDLAKRREAQALARIAELEAENRQLTERNTQLGQHYEEMSDRWITACSHRSEALTDVIRERSRQITEEGYTQEHDDRHVYGELGLAAALYALPYEARVGGEDLIKQDDHIGLDMALELACGWSLKPEADVRKRLVKSAALVVAEIERLDRKAAEQSAKNVGENVG